MENNFADTRRDILRKAVFVSPLIFTLPVLPSFAKAGSYSGRDPDDSSSHENRSSGGTHNRRRRHHSGFWSWLGL
jgi:hypothetical protein